MIDSRMGVCQHQTSIRVATHINVTAKIVKAGYILSVALIIL